MLREHTAAIVAAYLTHNPIEAGELVPLIETVHATLAAAATAPRLEPQTRRRKEWLHLTNPGKDHP